MSKVLLLGAPGNISASTIDVLFENKHEVFALTTHKDGLDKYSGKVTFFAGNRNDKEMLEFAKEQSQAEIVVDFSCFEEHSAKLACEVFKNSLKQYVFVSTVDVYGYPLTQIPMPENGVWNKPNCDYAKNKVLCENVFKECMPLTIVRPAYSMGAGFLLTALSRSGGYSLIPRLLAGKELFSPGDGTALIHASSNYNAGRMIALVVNDERCIGEDFTIAHDKITTYDDYITMVADVLGVKPNFVHIPSDFVYDSGLDNLDEVLLNDLTRYNVFFDVSKFKKFFPDFKWEKTLKETMKEFIDANEQKFEDISNPSFEDDLIDLYKKKNKE